MIDNFILLSAGEGRDMKYYGPKSTFKYNSKYVINYQIDTIRNYSPEANILTVIGFQSEKIVKLDPKCKLIFNDNYRSCQGSSIIEAFKEIKSGNVWIIHGDMLFSKTSIRPPNRNNPTVFLDSRKLLNRTKIGVSYQNQKLLNLDFGLNPKWSQIFFLPDNYINLFRDCIDVNLQTYNIINKFNEEAQVYCYENKKSVVYEIDNIKEVI